MNIFSANYVPGVVYALGADYAPDANYLTKTFFFNPNVSLQTIYWVQTTVWKIRYSNRS